MSDENFTKGIRAIAALWDELGKNGAKTRTAKS